MLLVLVVLQWVCAILNDHHPTTSCVTNVMPSRQCAMRQALVSLLLRFLPEWQPLTPPSSPSPHHTLTPSQIPPSPCKPTAQELLHWQGLFVDFYSKHYSTYRQLVWQHSMSTAMLRANFPKGAKELSVSLMQVGGCAKV